MSDQRFFIFEVSIETTFRDASFLSNFINRRRLESMLQKEMKSCTAKLFGPRPPYLVPLSPRLPWPTRRSGDRLNEWLDFFGLRFAAIAAYLTCVPIKVQS